VSATATAFLAPYLDSMQPLLSGGAAADANILLAGRLDRSRLDFSLESLRVIDDYLNEVHAHEQTSLGTSLLTTIEYTALYVGEIIRRVAGARNYEWITIGDDLPESGGTPPCQIEVGTARALRAQDGEVCLPSRAILRVILRGRKARSILSFARGAIEASRAEAQPLPAAARTPRRRGVMAA
jgi:hypothetical protein